MHTFRPPSLCCSSTHAHKPIDKHCATDTYSHVITQLKKKGQLTRAVNCPTGRPTRCRVITWSKNRSCNQYRETDYRCQFVATIVSVELGLVTIWSTVGGDFESVANQRSIAIVTFHFESVANQRSIAIVTFHFESVANQRSIAIVTFHFESVANQRSIAVVTFHFESVANQPSIAIVTFHFESVANQRSIAIVTFHHYHTHGDAGPTGTQLARVNRPFEAFCANGMSTHNSQSALSRGHTVVFRIVLRIT